MDNEINEMIERVLIQRNKTVDDMILGEIRKIATENGIDTIITLNDKAIIQALKNFVEMKDCEKCEHFDKHSTQPICISCSNRYTNNFKPKMDGGKAE